MNYKFLNRALLGGMLLISVSTSNAVGQSQNTFGLDQSMLRSSTTPELMWLDQNRTWRDPDSNSDAYKVFFQIEQNVPKQFYLAAFENTVAIDNTKDTYANIKIVDGASSDTQKSDITIDTNHLDGRGTFCKFKTDTITIAENNYSFYSCPAKLTAKVSNDLINTEGFRNIQHSPTTAFGSTGFDFALGTNPLHIIPYTESGTIQVVGADNKANKIAALAISQTASNDNIKIHFNVNGATDSSRVHLEFRTKDENIASLMTKSCDFEIKDHTGFCEVELTPKKYGNTEIDLSGSRYVRKIGGAELPYLNLPQVQVKIGGLYAGYNDGLVYRKGYEKMLTENNPVRNLAINSKNNVLYAINDTKLYIKNNPLLDNNLNSIAIGSGDQLKLQTLSLTNSESEVLVANGLGKIYKVNVNTNNFDLLNKKPNESFQSITSSYIDRDNNAVYFTDDKGNIGIYKKNELIKYPNLLPNGQTKMLIAAYKGLVYVSTNDYAPISNKAYLYKFVIHQDGKAELLPIMIKSEDNPFNTSRISNLFIADMGDDKENPTNLYAASNKGKIYRFDHLTQKWIQKSALPNQNIINDVVVDNLRNIYIAAGSSIWRIKNGETTASLLSDYSNKNAFPRSLVIDSNDSEQYTDAKPSAFKCKADGDKPCGCLEDGNGLTWYRDASQNTGNWYDWCSTSGSAANNKCSTNGAKLVRFNKENHCGISNWHLPTLYQHDFNDSLLLYVNRADGNFGSLVRHAKANNWNGNFAYPDFYSWLSNNFTVLPISNTVRPKIYWSQLSYDENQFYGMLLWNGSLSATDGRSDVGVALLVSGDTNFLNNEEVLDIRKQHKNFTPGYKDRAYIYEMTFNLNNDVANLIKGYSVKIDENPEKYRDANRNANSMNINFREYNNNYGIHQSSGVIIKAVLFTGQKITVFAGNPY